MKISKSAWEALIIDSKFPYLSHFRVTYEELLSNIPGSGSGFLMVAELGQDACESVPIQHICSAVEMKLRWRDYFLYDPLLN